jgi:hypothetical protein
MRSRLLAGLTALILSALLVAPAGAVTYGEPDNGAHPYVGLVVFYDATGTPTHRCSGTLLSPRVFLTAGHCTFETASAQVWFQERVTAATGYPLTGGVTGTPYTHPNFTGELTVPATYDIGVVVLDKRVTMPAYGRLPREGVLDDLAIKRGEQDVTFTVVGYGLQQVKPREMREVTRLKATVKLTNLSSMLTDGFNLHTSNAPGTGGGTCFGDSGGPVFLGNSATVAGVNSFVLNQNCKGASFAYRVDTADSLAFVEQFL